jgi:hypothetical protein
LTRFGRPGILKINFFEEKFYAIIFYFKQQLVVVAEFEGGVHPPLEKAVN